MAVITWNKELSVGVPSIDAEHRKLINLINEFYENIKNRSNNDLISKLISEMKAYTLYHFATEEKYMKMYKYPDYKAHKTEHAEFVAKVEDLEKRFNEGRVIISFEITKFLRDWVRNHILKTDMQYSQFFQRRGIQ